MTYTGCPSLIYNKMKEIASVGYYPGAEYRSTSKKKFYSPVVKYCHLCYNIDVAEMLQKHERRGKRNEVRRI